MKKIDYDDRARSRRVDRKYLKKLAALDVDHEFVTKAQRILATGDRNTVLCSKEMVLQVVLAVDHPNCPGTTELGALLQAWLKARGVVLKIERRDRDKAIMLEIFLSLVALVYARASRVYRKSPEQVEAKAVRQLRDLGVRVRRRGNQYPDVLGHGILDD